MGFALTNNTRLKLVDLSDDTTVADGATNTQTLQPNNGEMYKVKNIWYQAPANANAGNHELYIKQQNAPNLNGVEYYALVRSDDASTVAIGRGGFYGDVAEDPADAIDQYAVMHDVIIATYDQPVDFIYENNTGINQTGTRKLYLLVEVYSEAE